MKKSKRERHTHSKRRQSVKEYGSNFFDNFCKAMEGRKENKAGYTATQFACGWAGAIFEVTNPFGHEQ